MIDSSYLNKKIFSSDSQRDKLIEDYILIAKDDTILQARIIFYEKRLKEKGLSPDETSQLNSGLVKAKSDLKNGRIFMEILDDEIKALDKHI